MSTPIVQRQKRKPMAEINVVPYIDVVLVLLIKIGRASCRERV